MRFDDGSVVANSVSGDWCAGGGWAVDGRSGVVEDFCDPLRVGRTRDGMRFEDGSIVANSVDGSWCAGGGWAIDGYSSVVGNFGDSV